MRKRRYVPDSDENHDRWLISYADLVTLLFAFFVVMYAISQVNDGKYRTLSQSLNSAFAAREGVRLIELPATDQSARMQIEIDELRAHRAAQKEQERRERADKAAKDIQQALSALTREGQASVTQGALGITVDLDSKFLFGPGESVLEPAAQDIIGAIARVLLYTDFPLVIEGHTDNVPVGGSCGRRDAGICRRGHPDDPADRRRSGRPAAIGRQRDRRRPGEEPPGVYPHRNILDRARHRAGSAAIRAGRRTRWQSGIELPEAVARTQTPKPAGYRRRRNQYRGKNQALPSERLVLRAIDWPSGP